MRDSVGQKMAADSPDVSRRRGARLNTANSVKKEGTLYVLAGLALDDFKTEMWC
jgi:hypothetical protein